MAVVAKPVAFGINEAQVIHVSDVLQRKALVEGIEASEACIKSLDDSI